MPDRAPTALINTAHPQQQQPTRAINPYGNVSITDNPSFDGSTRITTESSSGCRYIAAECTNALSHFRHTSQWTPDLLPNIESALRLLVQHITPNEVDRFTRIQLIERIRRSARDGTMALISDLDVVGFGSIVSG